ncbi:MAG: hypothetical protein IPJ85_06295 [Flavobacteriales bacterium]|nr:hypothetical protein [Flavobacteriales bacterium]
MVRFNTIVGAVAEGDAYLSRPRLLRKFWKHVAAGEHLLIAAPRRVGKTSFMRDAENSPEPGFHPIYLIVESVSDEKELFRKLYTKAIEMVSGKSELTAMLSSLWKRLNVDVTSDGLKITTAAPDGFNDLLTLLKGLPAKEHFVFLVDEFSQAVENVRKKHGPEAAVALLHKMRELRQDPDVVKRVSFVFAGSVGLEQIVGKLNASHTINDVLAFDMPPFTSKEAHALIDRIVDGSDADMPMAAREHLLEKLVWLIPFFIQVVMNEAEDILNDEEGTTVTKKVVDQAFINALAKRNYYDHWHQRLSILFSTAERRFAKELLDLCSSAKPLGMDKVHDLGTTKHKLADSYMDVVRGLIHDGYLVRDAEARTLRFASPLLMRWWAQTIAH